MIVKLWNKRLSALLLVGCLLAPSLYAEPTGAPSTQLVGDPVAGEGKSAVCAACHGKDGNSTVPNWPKIAGQLEGYLAKTLRAYQAGEKGGRPDPVMMGMTQSLTDRDIADLASYFAKQTLQPGAAQAPLVTLGERIYRGGNLASGVPACMGCHDVNGQGNSPANFPRLGGQFAEYISDQLKKFRAGTRSDDLNGIMRDIAKKMTDEEIQAVSSYVSGLH